MAQPGQCQKISLITPSPARGLVLDPHGAIRVPRAWIRGAKVNVLAKADEHGQCL